VLFRTHLTMGYNNIRSIRVAECGYVVLKYSIDHTLRLLWCSRTSVPLLRVRYSFPRKSNRLRLSAHSIVASSQWVHRQSASNVPSHAGCWLTSRVCTSLNSLAAGLSSGQAFVPSAAAVTFPSRYFRSQHNPALGEAPERAEGALVGLIPNCCACGACI